MIDPGTIARLRELLAKATPGPWHVAKDGFGRKPNGPTVYAAGEDLNYVAKCMDFANTGPTLNAENAELIAAAVNALPALLALADDGMRYRKLAASGKYCAGVYGGWALASGCGPSAPKSELDAAADRLVALPEGE